MSELPSCPAKAKIVRGSGKANPKVSFFGPLSVLGLLTAVAVGCILGYRFAIANERKPQVQTKVPRWTVKGRS